MAYLLLSSFGNTVLAVQLFTPQKNTEIILYEKYGKRIDFNCFKLTLFTCWRFRVNVGHGTYILTSWNTNVGQCTRTVPRLLSLPQWLQSRFHVITNVIQVIVNPRLILDLSVMRLEQAHCVFREFFNLNTNSINPLSYMPSWAWQTIYYSWIVYW